MIKRKTKSKKFDEVMYQAVYATIRGALESILKTEYKKPAANGKETVDYEMTVRMIRSQARIALDLSSNIEIENQDKEQGNGKEKLRD